MEGHGQTGTGTGPGVTEISLPTSTYFESGHPVIFYVHCPTVKRNVFSSQLSLALPRCSSSSSYVPTFPGIASQDNCKKSVKSKPTNHSSDLLCLLDCPLGYVLKLFFFTCFQDNMKLANEGPVLSASTYGHLLALLPAQA